MLTSNNVINIRCLMTTTQHNASNIVEGFGELVTWWKPLLLHPLFASSCATRALQMKEYLQHRKESLPVS
jgi:hypothetical protein